MGFRSGVAINNRSLPVSSLGDCPVYPPITAKAPQLSDKAKVSSGGFGKFFLGMFVFLS